MCRLWLLIALITPPFHTQASEESLLATQPNQNNQASPYITCYGDIKDFISLAGAIVAREEDGVTHISVGKAENWDLKVTGLKGLFEFPGIRPTKRITVNPSRIEITTLQLPKVLPWNPKRYLPTRPTLFQHVLTTLTLSRCHIQKLPEKFAGICGNILEELNLSNNQIDAIDPNAFVGCSALERLDLSYNKLTGQIVKSDLFKTCIALVSIELEGNPEKKFPGLEQWTEKKDVTLTAKTEEA